MPLHPAPSELARRTMRTAFEELERTVTPADSNTIRSTTLEQTRIEALHIEKQLAARQALCNMRRLDPLLDGLKHYSNVVDILCNGTPFLPWIWAPITLILKVASEYADSFQQIMKGYSKIAAALSRFKTLNDAFKTQLEFQHTLAIFYADILEYHTHAYRFVRRSGWRLLFMTSWGRFQRRFSNILEELDRHGKLVDQQANALNIAAMVQMRQENLEWREKSLEKISREEKVQASKEYRAILSWLKVDETEQTQIIEAISDEEMKYPHTCSWLMNDTKIVSWLRNKPEQPLLWLQGNPGCGKSVIAAKLAGFLQVKEHPSRRIVRHFCTYTFPSSTRYDGILKSVLQQLLRKSDELIAHVYQECIVGRKQAGTSYLERLIHTLLPTLSEEPGEPLCVWIIIDGIHECEGTKQVRLMNLMNQISSISTTTHGVTCKVLLTTRPSPVVRKYFKIRKNQVIYLSDEKSPLNSAIRTYVAQRLGSLNERLRQLELEKKEIADIGDLISQKASGMFLYARLVLDYIKSNIFFSGDELRVAINQLPDSLNDFYHKLLAQILARSNDQSQDRVRCIFGWIAFAKRPLKKLEFLSALSFTSGNHELTRLVPSYVVEETTSSAVTLYEEQSLNEHGIAAVTCLLSGLDVLNPSYDKHAKLSRFVKGIHGFHVYATEYWIEYLLVNAAIAGGFKEGLLQAATRLADVLDKFQDTNIRELPISKVTADSKDERLELLQKYGSLRKHVERSIFARSLRRFESELQTTIEPTNNVPKIFNHQDQISIALDLYQQTVETLLARDSCPGASVEELELFKSQFRTVGILEHREGSTIARTVGRPRSGSTRQPVQPRPASNTIEPGSNNSLDFLGTTMSQSTQSVRENPRSDDRIFTSSASRDSNVGFDYLDIVMEEITRGMSMDPGLDARVRASTDCDSYTLCSLTEVAESLRNCSADVLTPEMMISKIWSRKHPELAQELQQFVMASYHPHLGGGSGSQNDAINSNMDTTGSHNVRRHCSCGGIDTDNMIACYNATCTHGWFHLSCKGLVVTPRQGEKWFCSDDCNEAEARESDEEDASDSDDY
ncbi:NACHT domain-containing protein [Pyrenophora tritici-repentis]|nr:NACHT domain-containing protein [Pyrenophora tritici-repentis]